MHTKIAALLKNEKLINYALVFGVTALGVAAVTVIAWSDRVMTKIKQKRRASGEYADTLTVEKDTVQ